MLLVAIEQLLRARRKRPLKAMISLQLLLKLPPTSPHTLIAGPFIPANMNNHTYFYVNVEVLLLRHVAWTLVCGIPLNVQLPAFQRIVPRHTMFSKILEIGFS